MPLIIHARDRFSRFEMVLVCFLYTLPCIWIDCRYRRIIYLTQKRDVLGCFMGYSHRSVVVRVSNAWHRSASAILRFFGKKGYIIKLVRE